MWIKTATGSLINLNRFDRIIVCGYNPDDNFNNYHPIEHTSHCFKLYVVIAESNDKQFQLTAPSNSMQEHIDTMNGIFDLLQNNMNGIFDLL